MCDWTLLVYFPRTPLLPGYAAAYANYMSSNPQCFDPLQVRPGFTNCVANMSALQSICIKHGAVLCNETCAPICIFVCVCLCMILTRSRLIVDVCVEVFFRTFCVSGCVAWYGVAVCMGSVREYLCVLFPLDFARLFAGSRWVRQVRW